MSSRLFPVAPTGRDILRETHVIWDTYGYSIPAERHCPYSVREQISKALHKDGFYGKATFCVYCDPKTWSIEDRRKFGRVGFDVCECEGGELSSHNMLVADLVYWSFHLMCPTNLLILSEKNKDELEEDPKFSRLFKALENKGCTITSAYPVRLFSPECLPDICDCPQETCLAESECSQEICGCPEETCLA